MVSTSAWPILVRAICGNSLITWRRLSVVEAYITGLLLLLISCNAQPQVREGLLITQSTTFAPETLYLSASDSLDTPVLWIRGDNITVDFQGTVLVGTDDPTQPDQFQGLAIKVEKGSHITIKNLTVKGYKVALLAEGVDQLQLLNCNFSYNYRPRLYSLRERESLADWLSYHENEADEWLRYGAAVYLKNCDHALVRNLTVTGGMNGLLMTNCNEGLFYNNTIQYNSGLGMGMYRSSRNKVLHNKLDWNVRGYSHGFYQRGQDSAGILCYEQSNDNTFAFNSATHSGDGFFLWAGQTTMDTGEGGCNGNLIYANDFSQAPTNGIEVTFSSNRLIGNKMEECRYGIWGGYSWQTEIIGNTIDKCDYGIAIEHGQDNTIKSNTIKHTKKGIQLWQRDQQPESWGYAQNRDVRSRNYQITENRIAQSELALDILNTDPIAFLRNLLIDCDAVLPKGKTSPTNAVFSRYHQPQQYQVWQAGAAPTNVILTDRAIAEDQKAPWLPAWTVPALPDSLADGQDVALPNQQLRGRQYILMHEWGPYDFRYPSAWLRDVQGDQYTFLLLGPQGNWKLTGGEGFQQISLKTGTFPATVVAQKIPDAALLDLEFEYIGNAFTDRFGRNIPKGQVTPFRFRKLEADINWKVQWVAYDSLSDPIAHFEAFEALGHATPLAETMTNTLAYRWWGAPAEGVPADRFATFARGELEVPPGTYRLQVTSDDGVRMFVNGALVLDRWDIHEPTVDLVDVELARKNIILIQHFDAGGLATLDVEVLQGVNE